MYNLFKNTAIFDLRFVPPNVRLGELSVNNGSDLRLFVTLNYCLDYSARLLYGAVLFLSPSFESSLSQVSGQYVLHKMFRKPLCRTVNTDRFRPTRGRVNDDRVIIVHRLWVTCRRQVSWWSFSQCRYVSFSRSQCKRCTCHIDPVRPLAPHWSFVVIPGTGPPLVTVTFPSCGHIQWERHSLGLHWAGVIIAKCRYYILTQAYILYYIIFRVGYRLNLINSHFFDSM